ncbi:MAG: hypothetical protein AB8H47_25555 [Bacteroidia bacterium]
MNKEKALLILSLLLLTAFSLSAQSPVKSTKIEVETRVLTKAEIQKSVQSEKLQLFADKKQLELQLTENLTKQERAAIEKRLEVIDQSTRNNQRILEGKAIQLGEGVEVKP